MELRDKLVAVLGLGRSGNAAARLLRHLGASVLVLESQDSEAVRARAANLAGEGIQTVFGKAAETISEKIDLAILSPGIDPVTALVQNLRSRGVPLIGELELAFQHCACPIVAITGTNGKTTTTELVAHIFSRCGAKALACGNIGLPFSEAVFQSAGLDALIVEVSSFQLESIQSFQPRIAAYLNFSPNHLDRYTSVREYELAKWRIFENQIPSDVAVVNRTASLPPLKARTLTFSATTADADFTLKGSLIQYRGSTILDQRSTRLPGIHNAENLMAALAMGLSWGLPLEAMQAAVKDYQTPPHRCEWVRKLNEVDFINDSKSTNLDALSMAIQSQDRPVCLIAGGKDKGFEFDSVRELVRSRTEKVFLIGEMRQRIQRSWGEDLCQPVGSLAEAVELASQAARPGSVVLFSPGTSSFDMFKNYEERGEAFKRLVNQLA